VVPTVGAVSLAIAVACGVGGCRPPAGTVPPESLPYDPGFVASTHKLQVTLERDGIILETQPIVTTCDSPDPARECARCEVATVLHEIDPEIIDGMAIAFARYPTSVRKAARLERVALCRTITYVGKDHGPAGLADLSSKRVFISVDHLMRASGTMLGIQETVHHEMFHLLDYALLGAVGMEADREWLALNPASARYGDPGVASARPAGFVNHYARTDQVEDRASTFQFLMSRPDEACELAAKDPVVARKIRLVWQRIAHVEGADRLGVTAACVRAKKPPKKKRSPTSGTKRPPQLRLPSASP
jgi:hypothetical protein